jgi:hypothetical protein
VRRSSALIDATGGGGVLARELAARAGVGGGADVHGKLPCRLQRREPNPDRTISARAAGIGQSDEQQDRRGSGAAERDAPGTIPRQGERDLARLDHGSGLAIDGRDPQLVAAGRRVPGRGAARRPPQNDRAQRRRCMPDGRGHGPEVVGGRQRSAAAAPRDAVAVLLAGLLEPGHVVADRRAECPARDGLPDLAVTDKREHPRGLARALVIGLVEPVAMLCHERRGL